MSWKRYFRSLKFKMAKDQKIYILPTGHGWVFVLGITTMILTAATYGNNMIYILAFFLSSVMIVSMVQTHNNLRKIELKWSRGDGGYAGDWFDVELHLHHPLAVVRQSLEVRPWPTFDFEYERGHVGFLPAEGSASVNVKMRVGRRGVYALPRWIVETRYPMGLFRAWTNFRIKSDLFIYPALLEERSLLKMQRVTEATSLKKHKTADIQDDDFKEHRQYRTGESQRHIDWKLAAKRGQLLTKIFEGEGSGIYRFEFGLPQTREQQEHRLSQLSTWGSEAFRQKKPFQIILPERVIVVGLDSHRFKSSLKELAAFKVAL